MRLSWIIFLCLVSVFGQAQAPPVLAYQEPEDIREWTKDIISLQISSGGRFYLNDVIVFKNALYSSGSTLSQKIETEFNPDFTIALRYGMDRYWIPGISVGFQVEYSFAKIGADRLEIQKNNNIAFAYEGGILATHSIGLTPLVEIRALSFIEYAFHRSLPIWWDLYFSRFEIFFYAGPRLNLNLHAQSDLKLGDLKAFEIGWQAGGGVEIFLSYDWSVSIDCSVFTNSSDFEAVSEGQRIFFGKLDLSAIRIGVCARYYF